MSKRKVLPRRLCPTMPSSPWRTMEEGTRKENIDTDEYKIEKVDSSPTKKETKKSEPLLMRRRKNIPLSKVDGACSFSPPSTSQNIQLSLGNSFQMGKYNFF